jgi:hypothetical protein
MREQNRFDLAIRMCDEANSKDPFTEIVDGESQPGELVYARRMSGWLDRMHPDAAEPLRLAARFQHIERWKIPREEYPMDRQGYLKWRNALKAYHADRAEEILKEAGYDDTTIQRVRKLVQKKGLKTDPDVQLLEDVICLVFLQFYLEDFARKHDEPKLIRILQKTWKKMSRDGQEMAMQVEMPPSSKRLVEKALSQ